VRYRPDGNIEFLGRIDQQVKVRGFRIELGEIEAVLRQIPTLREGVVVASDNRLIAYVVPNEQPVPVVAELKGLLRQQLPEYMVPSIFVMLDGLPLSPSGKVDRRALPAPDGVRSDLDREYVAPRTPTEETLATLCAKLLGIGKVGVHDNFFDLGGHSLLATQFISRLRDALNVELPLRSLFEHPTIAELATAVLAAQTAEAGPQAPAIVPIARDTHRMKRSALARNETSQSGNGDTLHEREQDTVRIAQ
jgi:acyl carrier protein